MRHTTYPRIRTQFGDLALDESQLRQLERAPWILTEKIHGANFCVLYDGRHVQCAKRREILSPQDPFFGFRRAIAPLLGNIIKLWEATRAIAPGTEQLALYGELFGGHYPHPDVPKVQGASAVQTGAWYAPDVRFCAFDLALSSGEGSRFLDFHQAQTLTEAAGLMFVQPLGQMPLGEAMGAQIEFHSTLPGRLGLPKIRPNWAEGIVLRPAHEITFQGPDGPLRPLIKRKPERFAERVYHQAKAPARLAHGRPMDTLESAILSRITPARVAAASSKVGAADIATEAVLDEVARDVFEELGEECPEALLGIDLEERELLVAWLREDARDLLS